jgi:hypothetical protein
VIFPLVADAPPIGQDVYRVGARPVESIKGDGDLFDKRNAWSIFHAGTTGADRVPAEAGTPPVSLDASPT